MAKDYDDEDVARLRIALTRVARSLDREVDTGGLTRTQLWVLGTIAARGPLGLGELAELERLNPTMLSRIVGRLSDAGLARRMADPSDGRAARVEVTDAGRELSETRRRERAAIFGERLAALPSDDVHTLLGALAALEALAHAQPVANAARS